MILTLKNKDEVTSANYKQILEKVVPESKIRRKIFMLIKKYQGQYEDNLRTVICFNNERKTLSKKKRDATIATLTGALDKLFSSDEKKQGIVEREKKLSGIFKGYSPSYSISMEIQIRPFLKLKFISKFL